MLGGGGLGKGRGDGREQVEDCKWGWAWGLRGLFQYMQCNCTGVMAIIGMKECTFKGAVKIFEEVFAATAIVPAGAGGGPLVVQKRHAVIVWLGRGGG